MAHSLPQNISFQALFLSSHIWKRKCSFPRKTLPPIPIATLLLCGFFVWISQPLPHFQSFPLHRPLPLWLQRCCLQNPPFQAPGPSSCWGSFISPPLPHSPLCIFEIQVLLPPFYQKYYVGRYWMHQNQQYNGYFLHAYSLDLSPIV